MRRIEGSVLQLRCSSCAATFPTFQFSGDTDMATAGLAAATSMNDGEIAIGEMGADELQNYSTGLDAFAVRISTDREKEFKAVQFIRSYGEYPPAGISFQEFRKLYRPPQLVFGCPRCGGEALVTGSESIAEFVLNDGKLDLKGDLVLA